jgi:hypothetical protein
MDENKRRITPSKTDVNSKKAMYQIVGELPSFVWQ